MEIVKPTPEEQAAIEADKKLTHAVEVLRMETLDTGESNLAASHMIATALTRIGDRAMAAQMAVLNTTIAQSAYVEIEGGRSAHWLVVTILCHWAERDKLEAIARQQALMGQPGPRRA